MQSSNKRRKDVKPRKNEPESMCYFTKEMDDPECLNLLPNSCRRSPIMLEFSDKDISVVDIVRAIEGGMNIVKFRMPFTTNEDKVKMLDKVEKASTYYAKKMGYTNWPVARCISCKTFLTKVGTIEHFDKIVLSKGNTVLLTNDHSVMYKCTENKIYVDYAHLSQDVKVGMDITIERGEIVTRCTNIVDKLTIECEIVKGGELRSLSGVNMRGMKRTIPFIKKADMNILEFAIKYQMDILVLYYTENAMQVKSVKKIISKAKFKPRIFCALCTLEGLNNIDEIIKESHGIIFARHHLEFELPVARANQMVKLQKYVAGKCRQAGVPAFITGVLEKVLSPDQFSDTDVFDVANSLIDGYTGIILRDVFCTENMRSYLDNLNEICCQIEPMTFDKKSFWRMLQEPKMPVNAAEAAVISCITIANQILCPVIIISTVTGNTVRALLWLQPACIVITVCTRPHVARLLYTCRNVIPLLCTPDTTEPKKKLKYKSDEERILYGAHYAVSNQWLKNGDKYISLQKSSDARIYCDMVKVRMVDFNKELLVECDYPEYPEIKETENVEAEENDVEIVVETREESVPFVPGLD